MNDRAKRSMLLGVLSALGNLPKVLETKEPGASFAAQSH